MSISRVTETRITGLSSSGTTDNAGTWNTNVDLDSFVTVPPGSTMAILAIANEQGSPRWIGCRTPGKTNPLYLFNQALESQRYMFVPLGAGNTLDLYCEDATNAHFVIIGFVDWTVVGDPDGTWPNFASTGGTTDLVTAPAEIPSGTTTIVMETFVGGWAPTGEGTLLSSSIGGTTMLLKLDGSKQVQLNSTNVNNILAYADNADVSWNSWLASAESITADGTVRTGASANPGKQYAHIQWSGYTTGQAIATRRQGDTVSPLPTTLANNAGRAHITPLSTAGEYEYKAESGFSGTVYIVALLGSTGVERTPATGSLAIQGYAPTVSVGAIRPAAGALAFTGIAPVVTQQLFIRPGVGSLSFAGVEPVIGISGTIVPATVALALTGFAPNVIQAHNITPPSGSLGLTGQPPLLSGVRTILPPTGSLGITGYIPAQTLSLSAPATGALAFSGNAPVISRGSGREPVTGTITFTGIIPRVSIGFIIQPQVGALTLAGAAPTFQADRTIRPPAGALGLSGQTPFVQGILSITPPSGVLGFTGVAPVLFGENIRRPGVGSVTLTGAAPVISQGTVLRPGVGTLGLTGQTPDVRVPIIIRPPTGVLRFSGQLAIGGGTGGGDGTDTGSGLIVNHPARQALRRPVRVPLRAFRG